MMKKRVMAVGVATIVTGLTFGALNHDALFGESQTTSIVDAATKTARNALQGQSALTNEVEIYVPSTVNEDKPANPVFRQKMLDDTLKTLSNLFGGATAVDGTGAWVDSKKNELVKEKVTIVYAYADKLDDKAINSVVAYVQKLKKEMTQSSVTLVVNGKMYFI